MGSGGTWRWPAVPEDTAFPHGFHRPYLLGAARPDARWFYATPQVCWEVHLLRFLLGCLSRGGMTLSAVFDVYYMLWGASMDGTMYAGREHFVKKLSVALMAYGSMELLLASKMSVEDFQWYLRPHHVAEDFEALLGLLRTAFHTLTASHDCHLFKTVRCCVLDGKWSIQTAVCSERASGFQWDADLQHGFFRGCTCRPQPGARFCREHQAQCGIASEETSVKSHREVLQSSGGRIEYLVDGDWRRAEQVPVSHVRAYEMSLLRKRARADLVEEADSCPALSCLLARGSHFPQHCCVTYPSPESTKDSAFLHTSGKTAAGVF